MDDIEDRLKNLEEAISLINDAIIADIEEIRKENKNDSSTDIKKT